jgi:DNA invertase Pin-like site-specific DNA recombinase
MNYVDRGESARSADRPELNAMLGRIAEDGDVDAVVVHKIDRLARNTEDHVAIRALLRRRGVALVSVTEGYHPPFDLLFSSSEFEYGDLVEVSGLEPPTSTLRIQIKAHSHLVVIE